MESIWAFEQLWWGEVGHYELIGSLMNLDSIVILGLDDSCNVLALNFWEYFGKRSRCSLHHEVFKSEWFVPKLLDIRSNRGHIALWAHIAVRNIPFLILHICCHFTIAISMDVVIPWLLEWVRGVMSLWLNFTWWLWGFLRHWLLLSLGRRLWLLSFSYLSYLYIIFVYEIQNVPFLNISLRSWRWNFTGQYSVSSHVETGWWGDLKWAIMDHGFQSFHEVFCSWGWCCGSLCGLSFLDGCWSFLLWCCFYWCRTLNWCQNCFDV